MRHKTLIPLVSFLAGLIFSATAFAAATGFITNPLWLTPEAPKEGEKATLSAAFRNADTGLLSGTVVFYDGDILLAKKPITISPNQIATVSTSFTTTAGSHSFKASMESVSRTDTSSGAVEPMVLPETTAKLPELSVSKKVGLAAQAGTDASGSGENAILKQVDKAEKTVLAVIPEPTKKAVAGVTSSIDSWREEKVKTFEDGRTAAKQVIADQNKTKLQTVNTIAGSKEVEVSDAKGGPLDGPWANIKLFFFSVLKYLFNTPLLFYFIAVILAYLILRILFRKIGRLFKKKGGGDPKK